MAVSNTHSWIRTNRWIKINFFLKLHVVLETNMVVSSVQKIPLFFKTSVCTVIFSKRFLRSPLMKTKHVISRLTFSIEKCQEIKVKGEKSEFKWEK